MTKEDTIDRTARAVTELILLALGTEVRGAVILKDKDAFVQSIEALLDGSGTVVPRRDVDVAAFNYQELGRVSKALDKAGAPKGYDTDERINRLVANLSSKTLREVDATAFALQELVRAHAVLTELGARDNHSIITRIEALVASYKAEIAAITRKRDALQADLDASHAVLDNQRGPEDGLLQDRINQFVHDYCEATKERDAAQAKCVVLAEEADYWHTMCKQKAADIMERALVAIRTGK